MEQITQIGNVLLIVAAILLICMICIGIVGLMLCLLRAFQSEFKSEKACVTVSTSSGTTLTKPVPVYHDSEERSKPSAYCGHCGLETYGNPTEAIDLQDKNYLAYDCHGCNLRTLLSQ